MIVYWESMVAIFYERYFGQYRKNSNKDVVRLLTFLKLKETSEKCFYGFLSCFIYFTSSPPSTIRFHASDCDPSLVPLSYTLRRNIRSEISRSLRISTTNPPKFPLIPLLLRWMANKTDPTALSVHGTNPQFLIEKILRNRIYNNSYWKEHCFGLTAETLIGKFIF